jgi:hypothetical protein
MKGSEAFSAYRAMLRSTFSAYRHRRFAGRDSIFEERQNGGAIVFGRDHATANLLIPPT